MLGIMNNIKTHTGLSFRNAGDCIFLLGNLSDDINCSEYLYSWHKVALSPAPEFSLEHELKLHTLIEMLISAGAVESVHDISDGGLFVALAESGYSGHLGFAIQTPENLRGDAFLFGEAQSRAIVSVNAEKLEVFRNLAIMVDFPVHEIGRVTDGLVRVDDVVYGAIDEFSALNEASISSAMSHAGS
jgi:phosphoribosylformylglycinamidine synthase